MRKYDKKFKEEAVKLSDEADVKQASTQLGIPYYTLAEWRQKRKTFGDRAFVGNSFWMFRFCTTFDFSTHGMLIDARSNHSGTLNPDFGSQLTRLQPYQLRRSAAAS